ncbi:hypothetical protein [Arabidopsis thaliana]|uniref:Uncharacterized protein F5E19_150 n=1 Tax=Arabidopsis thaliana TaxID=3702 RepID=Q9LFD7_ARATH|nr:hypothetical protein [Arabidopsis thaliana]
MNLVAIHRVSFECVSRFSLKHRESGDGFSGCRIVNSRGRNRPIRRLHAVTASLITSADSFEVGRLIGSYGFMNVTSFTLLSAAVFYFVYLAFHHFYTPSYTGLQSGSDFEYTSDDIGRLKSQDIGEGAVKIRLYQGRISQGPFRGTPVVFKVYPGQRAGGVEADMMAANELNAHSFLQSKSLPANLLLLVGGFETQLGEQWLAFRDGGKDSAADYAQTASEKTTRARSQGGAMKGLAFMHDNDRLHQSLGPSSIVLKPSCLEEGATSGSLSEQLWRRANAAGAYTVFEKRAFGIADDMYCLADERLEEAVKFLDLGDRAGWELLQAMLNADYRKRPMAEAVLSHRFLNGVV